MIRKGFILFVMFLIGPKLVASYPESLISYGPPKPYNFGYNVYVPETGDYHGHHQSKDLKGYTTGSYYLLAPDGTWHETTFSDTGSGYNAIMKKRHKDDPPDYVRQDKALSMYFNFGDKNTQFLDSNIGIPVVDESNYRLDPEPHSYSVPAEHPSLPVQPLHHFSVGRPSGPSAPHNKLMINRTPIPISTNIYLRPTSYNDVNFSGQYKRMATPDFVPSRRPPGNGNHVNKHLTPPPPPPSLPSPPRPSRYPIFESRPFKMNFGPFSEDNENWKIGDMIDDDIYDEERENNRINNGFRKGTVYDEEILPETLRIENPKPTAERANTVRNSYTPEINYEAPLSESIDNNPVNPNTSTKTLIEQFQYRPIRHHSQDVKIHRDIFKSGNSNESKNKVTTSTQHGNEIITIDNVHKFLQNDHNRPSRHNSNELNQNTRNNRIRNEEINKDRVKLGEDEHFRPILFNEKERVTQFESPVINNFRTVLSSPNSPTTRDESKFRDSLLKINEDTKVVTPVKPFESKKTSDEKIKPTLELTPTDIINQNNKFTHFKAVQKDSIDEIIAAIRLRKLEESKKPLPEDKIPKIQPNSGPPKPLFVRPKSPSPTTTITTETSDKQDSFKHNIPNVPQIDFDKLKKPGEVINKVKFIQLHGLPEDVLPKLGKKNIPSALVTTTSAPTTSRIFLPRDHKIVELLQKLSKERPDLVSTKPKTPSPPKSSVPNDVLQSIKQQISLQSLRSADSISSESSSQVSNIESPISILNSSPESENINSDEVISPFHENLNKYNNRLGDIRKNIHELVSIPVHSQLEAREVKVIPLHESKKPRRTKISKGSLNAAKELKPMRMDQYMQATSRIKFKPSKVVNEVRGYVAKSTLDNTFSGSIQDIVQIDPRSRLSSIETIESNSGKPKKHFNKIRTIIKKATDVLTKKGAPYTAIEDFKDYEDPMGDNAFGESTHYVTKKKAPLEDEDDSEYSVINATRFFLALPPR